MAGLLLVLGLAFGTYICKCLDYGLSLGVQNALSIRAQEIGNMFAATGKYPFVRGRPGRGQTIRSFLCIRAAVQSPVYPGNQEVTW